MNRIHFATISAVTVLMAATANAGGDEPPITVTRAEIEATKAKIEQAWQFFDSTWRQAFANAGRSYPAPKLIPYEKACRYRDGGNASYSPSEHVIRYDALFLTCVMKRASLALHSDGDYAPIVILAHEMGHAVAELLGKNSSLTILKESTADCLAGAVTLQAQRAHKLDPDDLEEAKWALKFGGDELDSDIRKAHGEGGFRVNQFMLGYAKGLAACDLIVARKLTP